MDEGTGWFGFTGLTLKGSDDKNVSDRSNLIFSRHRKRNYVKTQIQHTVHCFYKYKL